MSQHISKAGDKSGAGSAAEIQTIIAARGNGHPSASYSFKRWQGEGSEISGGTPALNQEPGNSVPRHRQEPLLFDVAFVERVGPSPEDRWAKLVALLMEIGGSQ
jgi:hypothetical protein